MALSLRSLVAADRPAIEAILHSNRPLFSEVEVKTALEMLDETLAEPGNEDPYQYFVAEHSGEVVGFVCFGTIPLTKGTFDLYWVAVHPGAHGKGAGLALMRKAEQEIAAQGGHLVVVETSSRKDYDKTRRFYEKTLAYETAARIRDFYAPGDDKFLYVKHLKPEA